MPSRVCAIDFCVAMKPSGEGTRANIGFFLRGDTRAARTWTGPKVVLSARLIRSLEKRDQRPECC
jgi:acetaldehyde dehydrogenase (acetylating)